MLPQPPLHISCNPCIERAISTAHHVDNPRHTLPITWEDPIQGDRKDTGRYGNNKKLTHGEAGGDTQDTANSRAKMRYRVNTSHG